jgi:hypothetical protein
MSELSIESAEKISPELDGVVGAMTAANGGDDDDDDDLKTWRPANQNGFRDAGVGDGSGHDDDVDDAHLGPQGNAPHPLRRAPRGGVGGDAREGGGEEAAAAAKFHLDAVTIAAEKLTGVRALSPAIVGGGAAGGDDGCGAAAAGGGGGGAAIRPPSP